MNTPAQVASFVKAVLTKMTPDQRRRVIEEVVQEFCQHCGERHPGVQRCPCKQGE